MPETGGSASGPSMPQEAYKPGFNCISCVALRSCNRLYCPWYNRFDRAPLMRQSTLPCNMQKSTGPFSSDESRSFTGPFTNIQ